VLVLQVLQCGNDADVYAKANLRKMCYRSMHVLILFLNDKDKPLPVSTVGLVLTDSLTITNCEFAWSMLKLERNTCVPLLRVTLAICLQTNAI